MDISPVRRGVLEIKRLAAEARQALDGAQLSGQARGTSTVVPRSEAPNAIPVGSGPGVDRAAVAAAKLAAEQQKAALAGQRLATEQQRTAVAAANVTRAETQAAAAALRYSQQQEKATAAATKGSGSFGRLAQGLQGIQGLLGAAGVSLGAGALIQGGIAAGQYSVAVRQTEGVLRQLAGSQERYNELTQLAAANQRLFGGSIAENYAPLTGVLALANQTGASLTQLNGVTQLLLAKAPGKSAGDAFFGLGEFLSGKGAEAALSLADQFNLNKGAIAALAQEGVSAEDRLKGLTQLLADQGVSAATLNARLTEQSVAYNALGAEVDRTKLKIGDFIANALTPAARGATIVLQRTQEATAGIATFGDKLASAAQQAVTGAQSYDDYVARIALLNQQLYAGIPVIATMNAAQYAQTRATLDAGVAAEQQAQASANQASANQASASAAMGSVNAANAQALATQAAADASTKDALAKLRQAAEADVAKVKSAELEAALHASAASSNAASVEALKLAAVYGQAQYPELLKIIQALREKTALEGGGGGKGGANVNATQQKLRDWQATADLAAAQTRYTEATESSAQRVARLRAELGRLTPGTAAYVDQQTKLAQAERTLASERTKAATSADKLETKTASAANAEAVAQRDALRRIEDLYQDHYDKLRRLDEDYQLNSSRKAEDYQIERQRLLAEGKIAEANLLGEKYALQTKRDQEDAARARQREQEQAAQQIADAQEQAGLKAGDRERKRTLAGVALAGDGGAAAVDAAGARQAQAEATSAGAAGGGGATPIQLQVQIAPTAVQIDGGQIVTIIWPQISQMIDAELTEGLLGVALTAPPATTSGGVGGPTP
jgi:hypothetical protein